MSAGLVIAVGRPLKVPRLHNGIGGTSDAHFSCSSVSSSSPFWAARGTPSRVRNDEPLRQTYSRYEAPDLQWEVRLSAPVELEQDAIDLEIVDLVRSRTYGLAGQLLEARDARGVTTYEYDPEGNLIKKVEPDGAAWKYEWNGAGMLARVVRPKGHVVEFGYDPLARRTFKKYRGKTTKWIWDGNVPLHEWVERDADTVDEDFARAPGEADAVAAGEKALKAMLAGRPANGPPKPTASEASLAKASAEGTTDSPVTWVFEPESFAPLAKIVDGERFGIVVDHLGTPRGMFDEQGHEVWGADIDTYVDLRNVRGQRDACPFRWPGQYEDEETGLCYNRWR